MDIPLGILLPLLGAHVLAAMSPGANTFLTLEAAGHSAKAGLVTAAGFWPAGVLWSIAGMWGVGALLWNAPTLSILFHVLASAYLIWLGWGMLRRASPATASPHRPSQPIRTFTTGAQIEESRQEKVKGVNGKNQYSGTMLSFYYKAFLTNLLNPKSVLYFSSVFAATRATQLPLAWKWVVILGLPLTGFIWYAFLVAVVNHRWLAPHYRRSAHWISRVAAVLLLILALQLLRQAWQFS